MKVLRDPPKVRRHANNCLHSFYCLVATMQKIAAVCIRSGSTKSEATLGGCCSGSGLPLLQLSRSFPCTSPVPPPALGAGITSQQLWLWCKLRIAAAGAVASIAASYPGRCCYCHPCHRSCRSPATATSATVAAAAAVLVAAFIILELLLPATYCL